ncbi:hypothetical protein JQN58_14490 [Aneurinibacillus sp. BA2021]|nr:hypothetical protein [Aneurinibacillus sp. BA2021]
MKAWWMRFFQHAYIKEKEYTANVDRPQEQDMVRILCEMKEKIEQAHAECRLDHDLYDECRHLLIRLDLLLPYACITPPAIQQRILHLLMEDAASILFPYLLLGEAGQSTARRDFLCALRYMAGEARRIIAAIQEYEREAFLNRAAFIAKWNENSKTHL